MQETSEQRQQRFRELRENIAQEMVQLYPNLQLVRDKYGIKVVSYTPYYHDGIKVRKNTRSIINSSFSMNGKYLTEQDAKNAIASLLPEAEEKYQQVLNAFRELKSSLDCDISYWVDGDTHGINDSQYISFKIKGFEFQFDFED